MTGTPKEITVTGETRTTTVGSLTCGSAPRLAPVSREFANSGVSEENPTIGPEGVSYQETRLPQHGPTRRVQPFKGSDQGMRPAATSWRTTSWIGGAHRPISAEVNQSTSSISAAATGSSSLSAVKQLSRTVAPGRP